MSAKETHTGLTTRNRLIFTRFSFKMFISSNRHPTTITIAVVSIVVAVVSVSSGAGVVSAESIPIYGTCDSNSQCTARIRSRYPEISHTNIALCDCYAASSVAPFDECEGESDETCLIADCYSNSCDGMVAYCPRSKNGSSRTCALRKSVAVDDVKIS